MLIVKNLGQNKVLLGSCFMTKFWVGQGVIYYCGTDKI